MCSFVRFFSFGFLLFLCILCVWVTECVCLPQCVSSSLFPFSAEWGSWPTFLLTRSVLLGRAEKEGQWLHKVVNRVAGDKQAVGADGQRNHLAVTIQTMNETVPSLSVYVCVWCVFLFVIVLPVIVGALYFILLLWRIFFVSFSDEQYNQRERRRRRMIAG